MIPKIVSGWRRWIPIAVLKQACRQPSLQELIKDPSRFSWHEVKKVDHYYLSVDALTQPMQVKESFGPYS
jgi:hypothetical protein